MAHEKSIGSLVAEWRKLAREANAEGNVERALALSGDANELQARLMHAHTQIQERHYDLTHQWAMKRVSLAAVDAELAFEDIG